MVSGPLIVHEASAPSIKRVPCEPANSDTMALALVTLPSSVMEKTPAPPLPTTTASEQFHWLPVWMRSSPMLPVAVAIEPFVLDSVPPLICKRHGLMPGALPTMTEEPVVAVNVYV